MSINIKIINYMKKKENIEEKVETFAVVNRPTYTASGIFTMDSIDYYSSGYKWVKWGEDNKFPQHLFDNYLKCSLFSSCVNRYMDYIFGNNDSTGINQVLKKCILDYVLFGGFAVECIRNKEGRIASYNYLNVMNLRVNDTLDTAYLNRKWSNYSTSKVVELPLYKEDELQPHFIYFDRGFLTRSVYPIPLYVSALKSIEILNDTRNFHKRNLENGFNVSCIINLNNGNIKTKEMNEIKEKLEEGYTGTENAGKFILINGGDKEHSATIERLAADNFGDLYVSLAESSEQDIMTAFGINEMLLGRNVATGFSKEEFQNCFSLFNSTTIVPIQNYIKDSFRKINMDIDFKPFNIDWRE